MRPEAQAAALGRTWELGRLTDHAVGTDAPSMPSERMHFDSLVARMRSVTQAAAPTWLEMRMRPAAQAAALSHVGALAHWRATADGFREAGAPSLRGQLTAAPSGRKG